LFIVKAANAMLIRSRKQMTKRMKIKGRILIRTLWSVLASIDMAGAAISLSKVHLSVRLPRPGRSRKRSRLAEDIQRFWGTRCLEAIPVEQHVDSFSLRALIALAVVIAQSHSRLIYARSELVCRRLETASIDCSRITSYSSTIRLGKDCRQSIH